MACGGFVCSKTCLCILNLIYVLVSLLLIGVAAWGKWFGLVSSFSVMGAVIAVGLFLFIVAIIGLCGAVKHHQVLLFFVDYSGSCEATCFKEKTCKPCSVIIQAYADDALQFVGGISLFFSFTEILGFWLAYRYRNQKDHRQNPGAFV